MKYILFAAILMLAACGEADLALEVEGDVGDDVVSASTTLAATTTTSEVTTSAATVPSEPLSFDSPPELTIDPAGTYAATLVTNLGEIVIELYADTAPNTVNNFVFLAEQGFYNGVIFHRVIPGFMAQGGDPTGTGRSGPGYAFDDELNAPQPYSRGVVAMGNVGRPNTNGSQFFIMHQDYGLPYSYSIFGEVVGGIEVVDAMTETPTAAGDRPTEDIVIESITITGP